MHVWFTAQPGLIAPEEGGASQDGVWGTLLNSARAQTGQLCGQLPRGVLDSPVLCGLCRQQRPGSA
jgi:hypothetical protein